MKNSIRFMVFLTVMLVCTSAWAVFDLNTDASLKFNLNFEINSQNSPSSASTTDAKAGLTGTLVDFNTGGFDVFREGGIRGTSGDFNQFYDAGEGGGAGYDCGFSVDPENTPVFEFGDGSTENILPGRDQTTFAFWFNMPNIQSGTFFRQEWQYDSEWNWEIRSYSGKLGFRHSQNFLRFETAEAMANYGVSNNSWHHAAVVFDRTNARVTSVPTTSMSAKMYIDGAEVPIVVTYYGGDNMAMDTFNDYYSPLLVGRGERDFDGLLDEVRIYGRALSALEISLIYQNDPSVAHTIALLPVPSSSNVAVTSDVNWIPASGSTQYLYFGTDRENLELTSHALASRATNAELGGPLDLNTTYYWYVRCDSVDSPVWSFTTENGKCYNPDPADGQEDVDVTDVNLAWSGPATALSYDVYYSTNLSLVQSLDASVQIEDNITDLYVEDVDTSLRSQTYYWCVVSNYSGQSVQGDVWSFTTRPYEIIFNTSTAESSYQDYAVPALGVVVHGNGWYALRADGNSTNQPSESNVVGTIASDGTVIYDFNVFNFDRRFDITVIPAYRGQDIGGDIAPRPIAIHVNNGGDFYFDGKIRLAGDDVILTGDDGGRPRARSGGFVGARNNSAIKSDPPDSICWSTLNVAAPYYSRFGSTTTSKDVYLPNATGYATFGPGIGANPPYKGGGGASYGGLGGNCGRGYFYGMITSGPTYGADEVPVPFGGSGGGWGGNGAGTSGGGGIEIAAQGDVFLDLNSAIRANGGDSLYAPTDYPGGGGSGGSVKIIAGGSATIKGSIDVSGGKGGNTSKQANECGGGGGGGRIAIFSDSIDTSEAVINVRGGAKGVYPNGGASLADDGQSGTYFTAGLAALKKASAPTPANGDKKFYASGSIPLKWYSGYGASTDEVYYSTNNGVSFTKLGATVAATRGQHTSTANMPVTTGATYYFKVITDGSIESDVWSFKVVNWQCPIAVGSSSTSVKWVAGPIWDTNADCVVTNEDFWYFAKDWRVERISGNQNYTLDFYRWESSQTPPAILDGGEIKRFVNEWMECINRTDGCASWN